MQRDHIHMETGEDLGADAVCAQCGTENPVSTFICRKCGNNLRDQRMLRLAADQELAGENRLPGGRTILRGVLTLLGVFLVLFTALNVDSIATLFVSMESSEEDTTLYFWEGEDQTLYEELASQVAALSFDQETLEEYFTIPLQSDTLEGSYVLVTGTPPMRLRVVGMAQTKIQGGQVYFAAQVQPDTELRGVARVRENQVILEWDNGAGDDGTERFLISGCAVELENGSFDCFGLSDISGDRYSFYAYRLPSN